MAIACGLPAGFCWRFEVLTLARESGSDASRIRSSREGAH